MSWIPGVLVAAGAVGVSMGLRFSRQQTKLRQGELAHVQIVELAVASVRSCNQCEGLSGLERDKTVLAARKALSRAYRHVAPGSKRYRRLEELEQVLNSLTQYRQIKL